MKKVIFLLCSIFLLNTLNAQNKVWVGGATGNWSVATNWNPVGVPNAGSHVKVDGGATVTVDVNATVASILYLGTSTSAGHLVIPAGVTLETKNRGVVLFNAGSTLTVNGNLLASSTDSGFDAIRNKTGGTVTIGNTGHFTAASVLGGSAIISTNGSTVTNNGTVTLQNISANAAISCSTGGSMTNNGTIEIVGMITNLFAIQGSGFTNSATGIISGNSTATNSRIDGAVTIAGGTISPGFSTGMLSFRNGFAPTGITNYNAEIANDGGTLSNDVLQATGAGVDIGNLNVDVSNIGSSPFSVGNTFPIFQTDIGYAGGTFSSITLPAGYTWNVNYGTNDVVLEVTAILPVALEDFRATNIDSKVNLDWLTATERNNKGFEVQRSTDGRHWTAIGFVEGAGNSEKELSYSFSDNNPAVGTNYYQLKQVDFDGAATYSKIESINFAGTSNGFDVWPNPSTGVIHIKNTKGLSDLEIFDQNGIKVQYQLEKSGRIDLSNLSKGTYYLKIGKQIQKVVLL